MLKRNLIIIANITIALTVTSNIFGQSNKGKNTSSSKQRSTKNARITKNPTQATGGTIPVYWNAKSPAKRKRTPANHSFQSTTQPFADGRSKPNQRKGGVTHEDTWHSKRKIKPRSNPIIILDQDGETEVARRKRKQNK